MSTFKAYLLLLLLFVRVHPSSAQVPRNRYSESRPLKFIFPSGFPRDGWNIEVLACPAAREAQKFIFPEKDGDARLELVDENCEELELGLTHPAYPGEARYRNRIKDIPKRRLIKIVLLKEHLRGLGDKIPNVRRQCSASVVYSTGDGVPEVPVVRVIVANSHKVKIVRKVNPSDAYGDIDELEPLDGKNDAYALMPTEEQRREYEFGFSDIKQVTPNNHTGYLLFCSPDPNTHTVKFIVTPKSIADFPEENTEDPIIVFRPKGITGKYPFRVTMSVDKRLIAKAAEITRLNGAIPGKVDSIFYDSKTHVNVTVSVGYGRNSVKRTFGLSRIELSNATRNLTEKLYSLLAPQRDGACEVNIKDSKISAINEEIFARLSGMPLDVSSEAISIPYWLVRIIGNQNVVIYLYSNSSKYTAQVTIHQLQQACHASGVDGVKRFALKEFQPRVADPSFHKEKRSLQMLITVSDVERRLRAASVRWHITTNTTGCAPSEASTLLRYTDKSGEANGMVFADNGDYLCLCAERADFAPECEGVTVTGTSIRKNLVLSKTRNEPHRFGIVATIVGMEQQIADVAGTLLCEEDSETSVVGSDDSQRASVQVRSGADFEKPRTFIVWVPGFSPASQTATLLDIVDRGNKLVFDVQPDIAARVGAWLFDNAPDLPSTDLTLSCGKASSTFSSASIDFALLPYDLKMPLQTLCGTTVGDAEICISRQSTGVHNSSHCVRIELRSLRDEASPGPLQSIAMSLRGRVTVDQEIRNLEKGMRDCDARSYAAALDTAEHVLNLKEYKTDERLAYMRELLAIRIVAAQFIEPARLVDSYLRTRAKNAQCVSPWATEEVSKGIITSRAHRIKDALLALSLSGDHFVRYLGKIATLTIAILAHEDSTGSNTQQDWIREILGHCDDNPSQSSNTGYTTLLSKCVHALTADPFASRADPVVQWVVNSARRLLPFGITPRRPPKDSNLEREHAQGERSSTTNATNSDVGTHTRRKKSTHTIDEFGAGALNRLLASPISACGCKQPSGKAAGNVTPTQR